MPVTLKVNVGGKVQKVNISAETAERIKSLTPEQREAFTQSLSERIQSIESVKTEKKAPKPKKTIEKKVPKEKPAKKPKKAAVPAEPQPEMEEPQPEPEAEETVTPQPDSVEPE